MIDYYSEGIKQFDRLHQSLRHSLQLARAQDNSYALEACIKDQLAIVEQLDERFHYFAQLALHGKRASEQFKQVLLALQPIQSNDQATMSAVREARALCLRGVDSHA